jgi:hypothetical protein
MKSTSRALAVTAMVLMSPAAEQVGGTLIAQSAPPSMAMPAMARTTEARRGGGRTLARSSAIGALTGSLMAMSYYWMSEKGERASGCEPMNCALPFLTFSGAVAGLFIGRELDAQRRAMAPRVGTTSTFSFSEAAVLAAPNAMDVRDSLIAVVSDSGAQLLSAVPNPKALRRRANGLSALRQVVLMPARGSMVLGTGTALWETSVQAGPATRLADGAVDALASFGDAVLSATGRRVRLQTGTGGSARVDSAELAHAVTAVAFDSVGGTWWVATDSQLVQFTGTNGTLAATKTALPLPGAARALAFNGEWIAAALGGEGVMVWRRASLTSDLLEVQRVTQEPRFAFDLAFLGDALYVAGGADGLVEVALTPTARVITSSRQLSFVSLVRSSRGVLWVGDRNRSSVVRVVP